MIGRVAAAATALWLAASAAFAAPSLDDYGRLPGIEQVSLSPSGNRYAMLAVVGDTRRLIVLDAADKVLQAVPIPWDLKVRDLKWAGDGILLVDRSKTYGLPDNFVDVQAEIWQTVALNLDDGKTVGVLTTGPAKDNGVWGYYGAVEMDGSWYGFYRGMTSTTNRITIGEGTLSYDLYRVDLKTGRSIPVDKTDNSEVSANWMIGRDGKVVARTNRRYLNGEWTLFVDGKRVLTTDDRLSDHGLEGLGRTPGSIVYSKVGDKGYQFMEWTPGAAEPVEIFADQPVRSLIHDPNTLELIGFRHQTMDSKYTFTNPQHQARVNAALRPFAKLRPRLSAWSTDFNKFLVFVEGDGESGAYYFVDIPAKSARQIGLTYPAVAPEDVGSVRLVSYKASDGTPLEGVLTLPPGKTDAKNLPVVILPHGGPTGYDQVEFDWLPQAFAHRGYAVFQPNFRGSTGYGRAFEEAGWGQWGGKMQTDVSDGLAHLVAQGVVDPKRACIVGWSYGGYAALAGVTVQQGLYRCAVSYSGVFDLQAMLNEDSRTGNMSALRYWRKSMGVDTVKLATVSPAKLARQADAPVLLIHGEKDTVVPITQSAVMAGALRSANKPVEFVRLQGEDHWLSRSETRAEMLKAAVAFVEKHNPAR